jgi:hypothetical protein
MEMQQMMEMLDEMKAMQERMMVKLDARNAELDTRRERMMACIGKTEATELKAKSENEPVAELQEVPKEGAAGKSSGAMKKRHRGRQLAAGRCGEP